MKSNIFVFLFGSLIIGSGYIFNIAKASRNPITNYQIENTINLNLKEYKLGDEVADFSLKSTLDKNVSLADYPNAKGFIIVFTSNHCPFSMAYEDRMIELDKKFSSKGYQLLAINPNDNEIYEEDSFENMKKRAEEKSYQFPYLSDPSQEVSKTFGAQRTPQVYVLNKENDKLIVKYIGAIDDNAQSTEGVNKKYAEDAVQNLLNGEPVFVPSSKAIGCAIRYL